MEAQTIEIDLTASEATYMFGILTEELPEATNPERRELAQAIAKSGLRDALAKTKMKQVRKQERINRDSERDSFDQEFPPVELPM